MSFVLCLETEYTLRINKQWRRTLFIVLGQLLHKGRDMFCDYHTNMSRHNRKVYTAEYGTWSVCIPIVLDLHMSLSFPQFICLCPQMRCVSTVCFVAVLNVSAGQMGCIIIIEERTFSSFNFRFCVTFSMKRTGWAPFEYITHSLPI